jgi:hypothetical protein
LIVATYVGVLLDLLVFGKTVASRTAH